MTTYKITILKPGNIKSGRNIIEIISPTELKGNQVKFWKTKEGIINFNGKLISVPRGQFEVLEIIENPDSNPIISNSWR